MDNNEYCVILTTTDSKEISTLIAGNLIKDGYAACVQINQVDSFFIWQNEVKQSAEYRLMIKAMTANYDVIEKSIIKYHNYDLPQIVKIDITGGLPEYLDWIKTESKIDKISKK